MLPPIYESNASNLFPENADPPFLEERYDSDYNIIYDPILSDSPTANEQTVTEVPVETAGSGENVGRTTTEAITPRTPNTRAAEVAVEASGENENRRTSDASTPRNGLTRRIQKRKTPSLVEYLYSTQKNRHEIEKEKLNIEKKQVAIEEQRLELEKEKVRGELRLKELEIEKRFELEKYELDLKYKNNN